jgi:hypothetical protein
LLTHRHPTHLQTKPQTYETNVLQISEVKKIKQIKMENKFKPTFPVTPQRPWDNESASGYLGLDKREHFALHLMTAIISNADRHSQEGDCQTWNYEHLSEIAIQAADAMLSKLR